MCSIADYSTVKQMTLIAPLKVWPGPRRITLNLNNYNELHIADFETAIYAINTEMFLTPNEVFLWTCSAIYSSTTFVSY